MLELTAGEYTKANAWKTLFFCDSTLLWARDEYTLEKVFVVLYFTADVEVYLGYPDVALCKPNSRQQGKYSELESWSVQLWLSYNLIV